MRLDKKRNYNKFQILKQWQTVQTPQNLEKNVFTNCLASVIASVCFKTCFSFSTYIFLVSAARDIFLSQYISGPACLGHRQNEWA